MWDVVADKLIAAMLMLGHSFPLHKVLEGHRMAQFVVEKHKEVRDQLVNGKGTGVVVFSVNNPVSAESSFSADAKLTDDDEAPPHRCQRCNRPKKEVSTLCTLLKLCLTVKHACCHIAVSLDILISSQPRCKKGSIHGIHVHDLNVCLNEC